MHSVKPSMRSWYLYILICLLLYFIFQRLKCTPTPVLHLPSSCLTLSLNIWSI